MKEISVNEALNLVKEDKSPSISIYLDTNYSDRDSEVKIRTKLHSLIRTIEGFFANTYDPTTRDRLLRPLRNALQNLRIPRSRGGLAIYHSKNFTKFAKISTKVNDLAIASESFHLKPVLRCIQLRRSFYLLLLRKKHAEFILVTADGHQLKEKIEFEVATDSSQRVEHHPRRWFGSQIKLRKQREIKSLMDGLSRHLETYFSAERLPLLLGGDSRMQKAFRKSCRYMNLVTEELPYRATLGNTVEITSAAQRMMERYFELIDSKAIMNYFNARAGGLASTNLRKIARAAAHGQIQHLLIAEDRHVWGHINRRTGEIQVLDSKADALSDDLLDDIAEMTLLGGGQVTVVPNVQIPEGKAIAAVLRWQDVQEEAVLYYPKRASEKSIAI